MGAKDEKCCKFIQIKAGFYHHYCGNKTHIPNVCSPSTPVCHEPIGADAERFPGNSNLPFSCDFGDLETEVHGVQIGWLPLEDIVTPPGFVRLRMGGRTKEEDLGD